MSEIGTLSQHGPSHARVVMLYARDVLQVLLWVAFRINEHPYTEHQSIAGTKRRTRLEKGAIYIPDSIIVYRHARICLTHVAVRTQLEGNAGAVLGSTVSLGFSFLFNKAQVSPLSVLTYPQYFFLYTESSL